MEREWETDRPSFKIHSSDSLTAQLLESHLIHIWPLGHSESRARHCCFPHHYWQPLTEKSRQGGGKHKESVENTETHCALS